MRKCIKFPFKYINKLKPAKYTYTGLPVYIILLLITVIASAISGCSIKTIDDNKISDVSYEVVEYHNLNKYVREIYNENLSESNRLSYLDNEYLYLIICYGAVPTTGYTIDVKEIYETANTIIVDTTLIGPSKADTVSEEVFYPAIVIKIKATDKPVIFK